MLDAASPENIQYAQAIQVEPITLSHVILDTFKGDGVRLSFDSNVVYFQEIIRQSGGIIMKLNKQNLELFINTKLKPELQKRMKGGI